MAKYLLTPTFIGSEVSLFAAIYWIAFEYFPRKFYNLPHDIEIWANFYIETPHYDYLSYSLLEKLGIPDKHMILNSHMKFIPDEYCQEQLKKAQEEAFLKIYTLFQEKKLRIYATQNSGQISDIDFKKLNPKLLKFSDFDIFSNEQPIIKNKKKIYHNILVSLDDLLKVFPLRYTISSRVKYAANQYFVDDNSNSEISFPGRKHLLSDSQLSKIYKFLDKETTKNPNAKQKEYIYNCITFVKQKFNIDISFTTMRDYIKKRK